MINSLTQIKTQRIKYGLNQKELAQRAGVSQSLIAKIEAGKIDPSYTKTQLIIDALNQLREKEETKAKDIMKTKVFFAHNHESIKEIIKTMKNKGISQVPVLINEKVAGIITENTILKKIADNPQKFSLLKAEEVMEDAPPIITLNTGLRTIVELLKDSSIVLVAEKGEIKGIISKADVLGKIKKINLFSYPIEIITII